MFPGLFETAKYVGDIVAQYAFGKIGDKVYNSSISKIQIHRILKKDRKLIEEKFTLYGDRDFSKRIEDFLFKDVFQDSAFLYPTSPLPKDKEDLLWDRFCSKKNDALDKAIKNNEESIKAQLFECVNYHNELVGKYILEEKESIMADMMQRNHSELLGYIGKTLEMNSEVQLENTEFDYTNRQLEGILRALRMDMRHYKALLMTYSFGILILASIALLVLPKMPYSTYGVAVTIIFTIAIVVFIYLFVLSLKHMLKYERRVYLYTQELWEINFACYRTWINKHWTKIKIRSE